MLLYYAPYITPWVVYALQTVFQGGFLRSVLMSQPWLQKRLQIHHHIQHPCLPTQKPLWELLPLPAVTAVSDGFVLQKSIVRSPLGGRLLSQCMAHSVQRKGVAIRPSYSIKRSEISPGQIEVRQTGGRSPDRWVSGSCRLSFMLGWE